jgi:uncharacterized protein (DUF58 family)
MTGFLPFLIVLLAVAFLTKVDFFFYLLYTFFGIYVLGRLWARRSLSAVSVHRRHDDRVFLGETLQVDLDLHNRSWLPVLWMRLNDSAPAELAQGAAFRRVVSLLPREKTKLSYSLVGRRRGYYPFGPLVTRGGDLMGSATYEFFQYDYRQAEGDFVIVYPRIVALRDLGFPSQSPFGTLPSRERIFEDPSRFHGVRDYQPGDSLRRMDWKASARTGALQVKRFEPAIALETGLFLNLNAADYPHDARYQSTELGIVIAASVAVHVVENRQAVGLVTNGFDPLQDRTLLPEMAEATASLPLRKGREHLMHILDLLARIDSTGERAAVPFLDLLRRKSLSLPWGSTVVVITSHEVRGMMGTLLSLRRRGLVVILVLTHPGPGFDLSAQWADQIGVQALHIWSEGAMDVWR